MPQENTDYTLLDLASDSWKARKFILGGLIMGVICAAAFTLLSMPQYKAQMTISPANPMNGADTSSMLADDNLFALRYLVQRVGVANSPDFLRFENKYSGASVAAVLLQDENIRRGLQTDKRFRFLNASESITPSALASYIARRVKLLPVGASSLRKMSYAHADNTFAMYFLTRVHMVTDELIRKDLRDSAAEKIDYLAQTIANTSNLEHRRALTTLMLEQERLRMLVSIETPYAAAIVEGAAVGAKPVFPIANIIYPVFAVIGAFAGFLVSGFRKPENVVRKETPMSAKQWFKSDAANITARRPLTSKIKAENPSEQQNRRRKS